MVDWLKNVLQDTHIDFVGKRRIAGTISVIFVLAAWVVFFTVKPNWGIDFTGGTEIHLRFVDPCLDDEGALVEGCTEDPVSIGDLRVALRSLGLSDDAVQQVGAPGEGEFIVRIQDATFGSQEFRDDVEARLVEAYGPDWLRVSRFDAEVGARLTIEYAGDEVMPQEVYGHLSAIEGVVVQQGKDENQIVVKLPGLSRQVEAQIKTVMGDHEFEVLAIDAVGPKVGGELRRTGFISIAATLGLVLLYIAFRFDIGFAPGAVLALFHDVSLVLGIFVLFQRELNLPIIGAALTIVGYSLNDTIVIYDRIRENLDRYRRTDLPAMINVSINETLARTLATSVTTMLAMSAFLVLGGPVIQNFALAMMLGIVFGTYSTVYVASPTILVMQDVKPYLQKLVVAGLGVSATEEDEEQALEDGELTESAKRRIERERSHRDGDDAQG